jgi:predicted RNA-binding Zn-ribbon protein involved in translation (DUF1610 family)
MPLRDVVENVKWTLWEKRKLDAQLRDRVAAGWRPPGSVLSDDPTCPHCGTVHNRAEVIRLLRGQSPEMFDFGAWSASFKCATCGEPVAISGSGPE